jgi:D-aminopeptidase
MGFPSSFIHSISRHAPLFDSGISQRSRHASVLARLGRCADMVRWPAVTTSRPRARDIGLRPGRLPPGALNGLTDVAGVRVGHASLVDGQDIRTGVTAILTHGGDPFTEKTIAAAFVLNGYGKTCGLAQLAELGVLETPIVLTNTLSVPRAADAVLDWTLAHHPDVYSVNPVVGECNDAFLNDIRGRHIRAEHVLQAIDEATSDALEEGVVGAGVGMSCFGYKGGIGSASRQVADKPSGLEFVVGGLVLANFGRREELVMDGVRVGEALSSGEPSVQRAAAGGGSVMVVLGTDAPLDARQLGRIARRGALGLARTGSIAHNGSGDFILAFTTAGCTPHQATSPLLDPRALLADAHSLMDGLFQAAVETVEEAVLNALLRAETVVGRDGHVREALPIEPVVERLRQAGRIDSRV